MIQWWKKLYVRLTAHGKGASVRVLVAVGMAGVLLIGLSEWLPRRTDQQSTADTVSVTATAVEQALERRISDLLGEVAGVGSCRVMVTLENGEQILYAADTTRGLTADSETATSSYLVVDTANGPVGLPLTRVQPTVRGVVVVCTGGGNVQVRERVQSVITTAFHISERRVCVVQQK